MRLELFKWFTNSIVTELKTDLSTVNFENMKNNMKKIYFSNYEINKINNNFIDHDGYFTKLVVNQKVLGYIFRCTHKDAELINSNNEVKIIPFLVTCFYQPTLSFVNQKFIKTLGKDQSLKTGIRSIKQYVKSTNDLNLDCFTSSMTDVIKIFPEYNKIKNNSEFVEFASLTEEEYKNIRAYINTFDKKTYKYYSDIEEKNILKIWLKN